MSDEVKRLKEEVARLRRENAKLRTLTTIDPLTRIPNRAALDLRFAEMNSLITREHIEVACLMIDVDHFRSVNEIRGHQQGDRVLIEAARLLKVNLRTNDFVGRYGGEEFGVILHKADLAIAQEVGERLRAAVENRWTQPKKKVTISIGIATTDKAIPPKELIERADKALYQAKQTGRNKVCVHEGK